jgi:hypothetical protein
MARYTIFVLIALGSVATALAAISPAERQLLVPTHNVTVIEKNQAFPVFGPLIVEPCQTEDCSEA